MKDKISILLIDDDEEDFIITRHLVKEIPFGNYSIDWANDPRVAMNRIRENKYSVYLVDYRLGPATGLDIIRDAQKEDVSAPFILLTGMGSPEIDEEAMKAGASDYLIKGSISSAQLDRSIRYAIEHRRSMLEIKELNHRLENRVVQRTKELEGVVRTLELTNKTLENKVKENRQVAEELQLALQKANELNEMKSRFISMASHEFRTPLTTIHSSSNLLKKYFLSNDGESFERHIKKIKSSVNNLTELLEYFLSAEKLDEGKVRMEPGEFDIIRVFKEHIHDISDITKQGQVIEFDSELESLMVKLDRKIFRTIIQNLLSNAIKYSGENTIIRVNINSTKKVLSFSIADEGIGIPIEEHKHLFERFYRAANVLNIQGTGLGLNIIKKYIELLSGEIRFESKPANGSIFFVTLPMHTIT